MNIFTYINPDYIPTFEHCFHCKEKPVIIIAYCDDGRFGTVIHVFALCKEHYRPFSDTVPTRYFFKKFIINKNSKIKFGFRDNNMFYIDKKTRNQVINSCLNKKIKEEA